MRYLFSGLQKNRHFGKVFVWTHMTLSYSFEKNENKII